MKFETVQVSALNFHDETFLIGSSDDYAGIQNSIKELGIINPPSLRMNGGRYQIICGWKRINICRQLGYDEIQSSVYEMDELSDEACLKFVFYDNQQRFNDIDKADLIFRFKILCGLDNNDLIRKVLPLIGIGATRKNLERYMSLAGLESEIREAYNAQKITLEQVILLSEVEGGKRLEIFERILKRFKLNNNETREVIKEVLAVTSRDRKSIGSVIDQISSEVGRSGGKNEFRHVLRSLRYPTLGRVEENYKTCLISLNLPKEISIFHPPFFEGNDLEIRLRCKSTDRLSEILSSLSSAVSNGSIEKLLNIVREGEQ